MAAKEPESLGLRTRKTLFMITSRVALPQFSKLKAPWRQQNNSGSPQEPIGALESANKDADNEEDSGERGNWGHKLDFMLSSIGYAVGLGNVWRFPYLCYINGGGAFLIPYCFMLIAAGLPMFVTELGFGQFASRGCTSIWAISPLFKGLGISMCVLSAMVAIYYNVVIMYTVFYFFASFTSVLPWSDCNRPWNTPNCTTSRADDPNITFNLNTSTRPSLEYWDHRCLGRTEGLEHLGPVRWQLALCLLFSWTVVCLCIIRGVKSSGKVWKDAAVQIFYSLGPAWGGLHTLASYNKFDNNFKRDGIIIAFINCGTSVFAGFVIFSVIGFMSYNSGLPIEVVADTGPGLAFVAYPEALARMPVAAPFFSILFFFMLFTLGLDSEFVTMETLITAFVEEMKFYYKDIMKWKAPITITFCVVFFLLGLPMTTGGGIYILTLMDEYCAGFSLLLIAFTECVVISYVYGINRFSLDMTAMVPSGFGFYWKFCIMILTPFILVLIFISFCVTYTTIEYAGYVYPSGGVALGWLMVIAGIISIPGYAVFHLLYRAKGFTWRNLKSAMQPSAEWGPASNKDRHLAGYPPMGITHQPNGMVANGYIIPTEIPPPYTMFLQEGLVYHETSI